ncbi:hypothetical protein KIW84_051025 [Lathyrus oleraceus]|uniref:Expansin-like EG45 domain-containing protein n=1 Tax=Pisum sativum TaxID=3888 RepID=A0A9D5ADA3_PEA|nr:hypothetical protein KIW84_051025 [Pisum sativum]
MFGFCFVCCGFRCFCSQNLCLCSQMFLQNYQLCVVFSLHDNNVTYYLVDFSATSCDGSRREQFPPGNMFVAVNEGLWDNGAACGRRYRVRCVSGMNKPCKGGSIDVKVVDSITSCTKSSCPHTFHMSTEAFAAISRFLNANINIEYIQI